MSNRLMFILGGFLVVLMIAACIVTVLKIDLTPKAKPGKAPVRTRNFGEGLKLSQHGLYGIDLVSIGRAHMRKLRKGPFTIGAINELVLEDVALVLPEELWGEKKVKAEGQAQERNGQSQTSPAVVLSKLGLNASSLKLGDKVPRFSALRVSRLEVSRLEGTNVAPWFAATQATGERNGLSLRDGFSVENGVTNGWKEAFLSVEPTLKLWTNR